MNRNTIQQPLLCFSIVSHGQGKLITPLLAELQRLQQTDRERHEVIVTLNIPEDERFLEPFASMGLRVIRNQQPKGFGANHNGAFAASTAQVFIVTNPDIRLSAFRLEPMMQMLAQPGVGLWAPRVLSSRSTVEDSARRFPTLSRLVRRVVLRQRTGDYAADREPVAVDWVAGMFLAIPRETYTDIRGFDERYYMYMEDADICRRLGRRGLKVIYDPRVSVIHDAQRASRRNWQHLRWHCRSALRFLLAI